ncbi:MAG: hypothetical protein JJU00_12665 [Opitutales bacterium]|nr:hypothetical protein [Opitutales bacterium]
MDHPRISTSAPTGVVGTYDHKTDATSAAQNTRSYYHAAMVSKRSAS